jgi:hypothetical protein
MKSDPYALLTARELKVAIEELQEDLEEAERRYSRMLIDREQWRDMYHAAQDNLQRLKVKLEEQVRLVRKHGRRQEMITLVATDELSGQTPPRPKSTPDIRRTR